MSDAFSILDLNSDDRGKISQALKPFVGLKVLSSSKKDPELFAEAQSLVAKRLYHALPANIQKNINDFIRGDIDHFVLRGMPTDEVLEPTPTLIAAKSTPSAGLTQFVAMAMLIGRPINKYGIANTIRFDVQNKGVAEADTWHAHPQSGATMFFCMRGDENVKTKLLRAKNVFETAEPSTQSELLSPQVYIKGLEPFALMERDGKRFQFSSHLFDISAPIQKIIPNLLMPDMHKMVTALIENDAAQYPKQALTHILNSLDRAPAMSYKPGDFAVYDECATVRHSPAFAITKKPEEARWLKAIGSEHEPYLATPNAALIEHDLEKFLDKCKTPSYRG